MADPQTRKLARQLVQMDERLKHLETVPQMAHSSIDDHGLPVYDKDGNLVTRIGKLADGTWGAPPLAGPTPPAPVGVTAVGGSGIIHVRWTGALHGGAQAPLDFDALEVLIDGELAGAISDRDGGTVTIQAEQGTRYVSARIRTLVPRHSALTSPFSVEVRAPAEIVLDDMTERADQLAADLAGAEQLIADEQERLDQARQLLDDLDATVDGALSRPYTMRGAIPPKGAPMGTQWVTPQDYLYVRVPCEEVPDGV